MYGSTPPPREAHTSYCNERSKHPSYGCCNSCVPTWRYDPTKHFQRFQPSEIKKNGRFYKFSWFWYPRGVCSFLSQNWWRFSSTRHIFHYIAITFGLIVKSATNIFGLEFLQFCQVSAFSCLTGVKSCIFTPFWTITITNFTLFLGKQKKPGGFEAKTGGRKWSLKTGGFRLKREGWNICMLM